MSCTTRGAQMTDTWDLNEQLLTTRTLQQLRPGDLLRISPGHVWVTYMGTRPNRYSRQMQYHVAFRVHDGTFYYNAFDATGLLQYMKHPYQRVSLSTFLRLYTEFIARISQ